MKVKVYKRKDKFTCVGWVQSVSTPLYGNEGACHFFFEKSLVQDFRLVERNQLVMGSVEMHKRGVIGAGMVDR